MGCQIAPELELQGVVSPLRMMVETELSKSSLCA